MITNKQIREEISAQIKNEIQFARNYKQGKIKYWQKNEEMYYGVKKPSDSSRANIELGRMQEFVHTLLSKINNPLVFKYMKRKKSQLSRADRANAIRDNDRRVDFWDIKDVVGKKQAIIYGRAIYSYFSDSINGIYKSHLENVDVYDFLIDPNANGIDIETAQYMGRYGVMKSRSELKKGAKDGTYFKSEVSNLLSGEISNASEKPQEEINKDPRARDQNVWTTQKNISSSEEFKFWEWHTTYEGERYYALITNDGQIIRLELLTDLFPATPQHPLGAYPFWTVAAFPDLNEFWTPSYCDYVREIFMGQSVSINQVVDNSEQRNKPQKIVNVTAIEDLSSLKYRKDGLIKTKGSSPVKDVYQTVEIPEIQSALMVYDKLEAIQEKASGVTSAAKGVSKDDVVSVYEGNIEAADDRFKLFRISYSFGVNRFGILHQEGMRNNLTKKVAVDIIGPEGIEQQLIGKRDVFRKDEDFALIVESSNIQEVISSQEKKDKLTFLTQEATNQIVNPKKAFEIKAKISGFSDEEINQLLDTSEFGDEKLMSEAERDIESIIDGKVIKPNRMATTAYKQRFVNYLLDHEEDMNDVQKLNMLRYIESIGPVIIENMTRKAMEKARIEADMMAMQEMSATSEQRETMTDTNIIS